MSSGFVYAVICVWHVPVAVSGDPTLLCKKRLITAVSVHDSIGNSFFEWKQIFVSTVQIIGALCVRVGTLRLRGKWDYQRIGLHLNPK